MVDLDRRSSTGGVRSPPPPSTPTDDVSDEEKRTLWVGGISDRVDEETLYELFINVSEFELTHLVKTQDLSGRFSTIIVRF